MNIELFFTNNQLTTRNNQITPTIMLNADV